MDSGDEGDDLAVANRDYRQMRDKLLKAAFREGLTEREAVQKLGPQNSSLASTYALLDKLAKVIKAAIDLETEVSEDPIQGLHFLRTQLNTYLEKLESGQISGDPEIKLWVDQFMTLYPARIIDELFLQPQEPVPSAGCGCGGPTHDVATLDMSKLSF